MGSAGIIKKMEVVVYGGKPTLTIEGQDSVDLESVLFLYKITAYFIIVCLIIFMLECIFGRLKSNGKRKIVLRKRLKIYEFKVL